MAVRIEPTIHAPMANIAHCCFMAGIIRAARLGWIEFIPIGRWTPVRTPRETTQPNRRNAVYWATGLTPVYLEGALDRALHPPRRQTRAPGLSRVRYACARFH